MTIQIHTQKNNLVKNFSKIKILVMKLAFRKIFQVFPGINNGYTTGVLVIFKYVDGFVIVNTENIEKLQLLVFMLQFATLLAAILTVFSSELQRI